jgi:hypothetical protein
MPATRGTCKVANGSGEGFSRPKFGSGYINPISSTMDQYSTDTFYLLELAFDSRREFQNELRWRTQIKFQLLLIFLYFCISLPQVHLGTKPFKIPSHRSTIKSPARLDG